MPPATSTLVGKRSLNEVTGQENRVTQTSRFGPLHSTLLYPNNPSPRGWKDKAHIWKTPLHFGEPSYLQGQLRTWKVAVRQRPPVLLFLWCFCRELWPAAEAAKVPGSVYHPDEGVPRPQARGARLSGWVTAKITCSWQEGCEDGLLSPDHFRAHVAQGAVGRVCGFLTLARKQLLWENCSRCHSWKQPRARLLCSQWFYKHLPPCVKFLSIYNQVTSDNHN